MPEKINERLKDLLEAGQGTATNMATGMSFPRAAFASAGDMMLTKVLGPAAGVAGVFLAVSRTLGRIIQQTDMWGKGMEQMRRIEQWESKFETILRSATLAKERMKDLSSMSVRTPFNLNELAAASRNLEVLTKGAYSSRDALSAVGDAAAATGTNIEDVSFTIGKLYNFLESGRSVQNLAFHLQSMGVISGELQNRLELMQASGAGFTQMWGVVTNEINRTRGAMAAEMETIGGLTARLAAARDLMAKGYGESFVEQEKNTIYASLKVTETLSPALKLIGRDVAAVTGVWRGWTSALKGSIFDTLGASRALEMLWRGFTIVGAGVGGTVAASVGKFIGGLGKQRAQIKSNIAAGLSTDGTRDWLRSRARQQEAASKSFENARGYFENGAFAQAGVSLAMGAVNRGRAYVSRLVAAGSAAAAGAREALTATTVATGQKLEEAMLRRTAAAAAAKAVAMTAVGDAVGVAVSKGKLLVGMLTGMVKAIPGYGWAAAGIAAATTGLIVWIRYTRDARNRLNDLTNSLNASRDAFLRQAQAITTAEQRSAALTKAFENLRNAQTAKANAKNKDEIAVASDAIALAKSDIVKTQRRLVGRSRSEEDIQGMADRKYYERYERPVAELEIQAEGASPARRAAIAEQIAGIRRAQRDEAEKRIEEQTAFANSDRGHEYEGLIHQRDSIAGAKDAADVIADLRDVVERNKFTVDFRGMEYDKTVIGGHRRGTPEGRAAEARSIAARDEIARLRAYEKPENAKQFEQYKQVRIEEMNKRIDALSPDSETTGRVRALTKESEDNPNLSDSQRIAKVQEAQELQAELQARNQNAQRFKGAGGAESVDAAERAARIADIELRAFRERMNLEYALLNIKETGWEATKQEMDARINSAKRELDLVRQLARERGQADHGAEQEAKNRVASLVRDRALAGAQHKEARRQAEAPLKEMEARNAIGVAMLKGDTGQVAYLQDEERRRQLTERLYNARVQGIQSGLGGDEAVEMERRKIGAEQESEFLSQYRAEQEQALANETDPGERKRIERGLAFRNRIGELTAGGMEANAARSKAEGEFGGYSSDLSAADSAAGFYLAGRGNVESRLATDMASFNTNVISPAATAEEQAKRSTPLTEVLKSLDQKIKEASAVLVMKEGGR